MVRYLRAVVEVDDSDVQKGTPPVGGAPAGLFDEIGHWDSLVQEPQLRGRVEGVAERERA